MSNDRLVPLLFHVALFFFSMTSFKIMIKNQHDRRYHDLLITITRSRIGKPMEEKEEIFTINTKDQHAIVKLSSGKYICLKTVFFVFIFVIDSHWITEIFHFSPFHSFFFLFLFLFLFPTLVNLIANYFC